MSRFWSSLLHQLSPYVPGEQRNGIDVVKLNTNENPYPPSERVMQAIAAVDSAQLRHYPQPQSQTLRNALAQHHKLGAEQVFVGNGSDEVLALAFLAFFKESHPLVFPAISYSFYPVYCKLFQIPYIEIPMNADFSIDWSAVPEKISGIVFPNPNAPTGIACGLDAIKKLLTSRPSTVILIDEAYVDFSDFTATTLIDRYPNLLVTQTFSKSRSLAGMRIGAAFGHADLIDGLDRVKNSFNSYPVDVVAEQAAISSLQDDEHHQACIKKIIKSREALTGQLEARGFRVLPSQANFIFVSPGNMSAKHLHQYLDDRDILVRYWNTPALQDWLRISIGTDEELHQLVDAIDQAQA